MANPVRMVRSASLNGYVQVAESVGLDAQALLRAVGLPARCLEHSEMPLALETVRVLLERSAEASGREDFALRLAAQRNLAHLGPISLVLKEEPTARLALETLCRYLRLLNASLMTRLDVQAQTITLREEMHMPPGVSMRQPMELTMGVMFRILRELLGAHWSPIRVSLTHRAPRDPAPHQAFFGPCVCFNQEFNGIVCLRTDLEAPQVSQASGLARFARQYLDEALAMQEPRAHETVRQLIAALLPGRRCTSLQVASHLRMDRRTLHRHLAREGCSFSSLLDDVRLDLARRQIRDTDLPLSEVAGLLGFATPSAFGHWFRQRMGCCASDWRRSEAVTLSP
ncbi:MAG: AraC family transcriptional regulator [Burkholderiaceae bacterium]|nr:AraC family transcriptional regulator [Burkholderiaceae bacterium]